MLSARLTNSVRPVARVVPLLPLRYGQLQRFQSNLPLVNAASQKATGQKAASPEASKSKAATPQAATPKAAAPKAKEPLMQRIKHEVKHYVNGTKLLGYELKISTKLLAKFVQGYELSRRENNQLKRTMSDIFRLVPFSAFVIIPFAELLLPLALKLFPNLLPSTYESGSDRQKKTVYLIDTRRKTSDFLHETLAESNLLSYNSIETAEKKKKFLNFFKKLNAPKDGDHNVFTHEEVLSVAKMFKNDTVLDNLSRPQLVAMSKFMSITPFGNDNMLRYRIRHKLRYIMEDDKVIDYEGVNCLSEHEIYQACVSRGVKAYSVSKEELMDNLRVWLDLRLHEKVPSVLLVLSSTFTFGGLERKQTLDSKAFSPQTEHKTEKSRYDELKDLYYDGILHVLSSIPDPVYNVAKLDVSQSKQPTAAETKQVAEDSAKAAEKAANDAAQKEAPESVARAASAAQDAKFHAKQAQTAHEKEQAAPQPAATATKASAEAEAAAKASKKKPEEVAEDEEVLSTTDDNEFKLKVLKEQEELIKKEQEDAKARNMEEPVADDITLDEEEKPVPPIPAEKADETSVTKKKDN